MVLASCQTASGAFRRGEGVMTLARPFLAAGVPDVVASLWDLDDRAARAMFRTFHQQIRRGLSVPGALRQAQLDMMGSGDAEFSAPVGWAGIVAIGG
jgi:CHAT domain-containing protein